MNLGRETVRAAFWTVGGGIGSRVIGLVGTLVITRYIAPADYGEVTVAAVLVMTANQLSTVGLGQYIVSRPDAERSAVFHATAYHISLGVIALVATLALGPMLGSAFDAPSAMAFLPGLALATLFDRIAFVPERILARDIRFGILATSRTFGDLTFTAGSVGFAAAGYGASAIVIGNLARSFIRLLFAVDRRDWLEPVRLSLEKTRELFAFGLPMAFAGICAFASRRWDNLLVARFFGPGPAGMYNLAYNLADVPAIQVGEQIGDVLLPSFARLPPDERPAALLRSLGLLALAVFPLAIGLAAVAPTLVQTLFDPRWQPIAPMLVLLSALSVARPVSWTVASYLQAARLPRYLVWLEGSKVLVLVLAIVTIGRSGPLWTCAAVGLAFCFNTVASLWVVERIDRLPLKRSLASLVPALLACVPMVALVLAARHVSGGMSAPGRLVIETLAGTLGYALGAVVVARKPAREFVTRVVGALRPRAAERG